MSFHLVDRIHALEPGKSARATLHVPAADFPVCLVAEAVGQVAAWVAMERSAFDTRPVAAIVGELVVGVPVPAGATLEMTVDVTAMRSGAIRYGGRASSSAGTHLELRRCTGALLPMDVFDDPAAVRARFALLRGDGEPPRRFPTAAEYAPRVEIARGGGAAADELHAELEAPHDAALYADHFPRRAVYPATLLLDAKIRIAQELLRATTPAGVPDTHLVRNAKVRAFTPPGGRVRVVAQRSMAEDGGDGAAVRIEAFSGEERVSAVTAWFAVTPA